MVHSYPIALKPHRERFEYFQTLVDQVFCPMQVDSIRSIRESFDGHLDAMSLRHLHLARVATAACTVRRRREDIARYADAAYLIKFQAQGRSVWMQRNREIHLKAGDFVVCTTAEPYTLHFLDSYVMPVIAISAREMRRLTPDPERFLGVRFPAEEPDCGLLSNFVADVTLRLHALREPMIGRVEANIMDLLGAVLAARASQGSVSAAERLAQVKVYIDEHLRDSNLSPAGIARVFGISTRYVHTLFDAEPLTIGRYIRRSRVAACLEALSTFSPSIPLSELALQWGFYDGSHMTRAFRDELGVTPSDLRKSPAALQNARLHP